MGWTDWFSRKDPADEVRPSLRDVKFDIGGMKVLSRTPASIEWKYGAADRVTARIDRATSDQPLTPWTLDALRSEYRRSAAVRSGGIVSVTLAHANAIPLAQAISKFQDGAGYRYEGTVSIRFRDAQFSVTMQAGEGRSTGTREAMVTGLLFELGLLQIPVIKAPAVSAKVEGWMRDPYDERYDDDALHTPSDDERLDELLPAHPLSRVRRFLDLTKQTLSVASDLRGDLVAPTAPAPSSSETRQRMPPFALGVLFMQIGRLDLAEHHVTAGLSIRDGEPSAETPRLGDTLILLGAAREALGRVEDAAWALERAVRTFAAMSGDDDLNTVRARANLGRVYASMGRAAEAEPLLTDAIPLFEKTGNKSELAIALNALGLVRQSQTRHADALAGFKRALTLFEELHGPNFLECATVLKNIARSADATGDRVEREWAQKRARRILRGDT